LTLAFCGVWLLGRVLLAPPIAPMQAAQLRFLHAGFAGQLVEFAAETPGLHLAQAARPANTADAAPAAQDTSAAAAAAGAGAVYLLNQAQEVGRTSVDLCMQRSRGARAPDQLLPIRFLSGEKLAQAGAHRQAVVFDVPTLPQMPAIQVEGSASESGAVALTWRVAAVEGAQVVGGRAVLPAPAVGGHWRQHYQRGDAPVWVLWKSGGQSRAVRARAEDARGSATTITAFQMGLRGRWVPDFSCAAGRLELTVFAAAPGGSGQGGLRSAATERVTNDLAAPTTACAGDAAGLEPAAAVGAAEQQGEQSGARCARATLVIDKFVPGAGPQSMRFASGRYRVPLDAPPPREDRELFEAAVARGMIGLTERGLIDYVPADRLVAAELTGKPLDRGDAAVVKQLHRWASGERVQAAIAQWNAERRTAAVRVAGNTALVARAEERHAWSVLSDGMPLVVERGLSDEQLRFMDRAVAGAGEWLRVSRWPAGVSAEAMDRGEVVFSLATRPEDAGQMVQVSVIGRTQRVVGAEIVRNEGICTARACRGGDDIQLLTLRVGRDAQSGLPPTALELVVVPSSTVVASARARSDQPIGVVPEPGLASAPRRLEWHEGNIRLPGDREVPAQVTLTAVDGTELSVNGRPTAAAQQLGLAPLVGVAPAHGNSVAGVLSRLPQEAVTAQLTIDPALQAASLRVLECVGHHNGRFEHGACVRGQAAPVERRTGMVIMDADTGAIVAAAAAPRAEVEGTARDWLAVDRYHPARSLLRWTPWAHDGGGRFSPGSAFKVVDSLALEALAKKSPEIERVLAGQSGAATNWAQHKGLQFSMTSACYPSPCAGSQAQVTNYHDHTPQHYVGAGGFGLPEALGYSLNTWYSMLVESVDNAALSGHSEVRALTPGALDSLRPTVAMAERLGFGRAWRLDGGLLPVSMRLRPDDLLLATPSRFDPIDDVGDVRRLALGLRMQATTLQMALVAASVATGAVPTPMLLAGMDGRAAVPQRQALGVRTDRIRAGMALAVSSGTARGAFARRELDGVRRLVWGKTGTAPHGDEARNNAWFVGGLEPGALPGQTRRLVFAVQVSNTGSGETGGARAATVVAELLTQLQTDAARRPARAA